MKVHLHGISVDSIIERIEGGPEFAESVVENWRKAGHVSEYLFAARTEEEFEQKKQDEIHSARPVYPNNMRERRRLEPKERL